MPKYKLIIHHEVEFEADDYNEAVDYAAETLGGIWINDQYKIEEIK